MSFLNKLAGSSILSPLFAVVLTLILLVIVTGSLLLNVFGGA